MRRRPFTLIELMVALALSTLVLSSTLGIYHLLEKQAIIQREQRSDLFAERYLQYRLSTVFARAMAEKNAGRKTENKDYEFFTSSGTVSGAPGTSLVFVTDRGPDEIPELSNEVLARLYRDGKGALYLAYWPLPSRWEEETIPPIHKELLMEGVKDLQFEFFVPPNLDLEAVSTKDYIKEGREIVEPDPGIWHTTWERNYKKLPPLIKVKIALEKESRKQTFAFFLAGSLYSIELRR